MRLKKILITAGPTWVPIDSVRVVGNIATGQTGTLLADKLMRLGARVTLLLGPVNSCCLPKKIKLIKFRFFDELRNIVKKELESDQYDTIIHSAAVADFRVASPFGKKIKSGRVHNLRLLPLPKIIRDIRILAPKAQLVMFKLETGVSKETLIQRAGVARHKARADFVVANMPKPYRAFIIGKTGSIVSVKSKKELVKKLLNILRIKL